MLVRSELSPILEVEIPIFLIEMSNANDPIWEMAKWGQERKQGHSVFLEEQSAMI